MTRAALLSQRKRKRLWYLIGSIVLLGSSLLALRLVMTEPYTTRKDCVPLSGVVIGHGRNSEAIVKLDNGKEIFARSNLGTINRKLALTRKKDRVTGLYLEWGTNVMELFVNGEKIADFEDYHEYEKWERKFIFGLAVVVFLCSLSCAWNYWEIRKG